jgi:ATP-dependent Clp protease ATP-binding subunit ClpC
LPGDLRARIDAFNSVAQAEAASRGFLYEDITALSPENNDADEWLAADGLHPGPAQHRAIADRIWERARTWATVGLDRWSSPATQVLTRARDEARTLHVSYIGTEHLLLSLLRDTEGAGGKLLSDSRISYSTVRNLISRVLGKSKQDAAPPSAIIPTTRVRKVLRIASQEANSAGSESVGSEHILLALALEGEGIAAHVLSDMGVTPARIRTAMSPPTDKEQPG